MRVTETEWAIRNLELAGWCDPDSDYDGMIGAAVKNLLLTHQREGHSGASHYTTLALFHKVATGEALTMQFWEERFKEFNRMCREHGADEFTPEQYSEAICKKPENAFLERGG